MDRAVVQLHYQLPTGAGPGLIGFPHVDVSIRGGIVTEATAAGCYRFSEITCGVARVARNRS